MQRDFLQKMSSVPVWARVLFFIAGIAIFVIIDAFRISLALTIVLIWTWIAIYRLYLWGSRSRDASLHGEHHIWHEQPDVLWIIASFLIVLMGLLQLALQGLMLNHAIAGHIFDTVDIVYVVFGVPALFLLGRVFLLQRKQGQASRR